jgi:hypothetical protein
VKTLNFGATCRQPSPRNLIRGPEILFFLKLTEFVDAPSRTHGSANGVQPWKVRFNEKAPCSWRQKYGLELSELLRTHKPLERVDGAVRQRGNLPRKQTRQLRLRKANVPRSYCLLSAESLA